MAGLDLKRQTRVLEEGKKVSPALSGKRPSGVLRVVTIVVLAVIVQTTVAPYLTVLGTKPNSALVTVVCLALLKGPVWGAVVGFGAGLLLDIALVQTMGISSFLFTLAGYFSGRYAQATDPQSWFPPLFTVFVSTVVLQTLNAVIMFLLGIEASVGFVLFKIVLPEALLNALLAPPLFVVCRWWLGVREQQIVFSSKE